MKLAAILFMLGSLVLAGCGHSGVEAGKPTAKEEAREKSVFWQIQEPRVQLDPIAEEEVPSVIGPVMEGED